MSLILKKFENKIFIKKRIDNEKLPELFNYHENFIIASDYEGNPKSLLEAMACELMVIGSNVRGINSVIEDGKNGFLFDKKNLNSLTKIIDKLLTDFTEKEIFKKNARLKILKFNSKDLICLNEKKVIDHLKLSL